MADSSTPTMRRVQVVPMTALVAQVLLFAGLAVAAGLGGAGLSPAGWVVGIACGVIINGALAGGLAYYRADGLSPADRVTLARATLAIGVAALVADSFARPAPVTLLVSVAVLALALDAVDGWVARRTGTTARLGARFDGEVDAFLILALSVYVARAAGAWVLAIGAARYAFLAAGWPLPWLRAPLPPRYWRKVVAAIQGIVLTVVASDVLPPGLARVALIAALALLAESFGRDVWWLHRNRTGRRRRGFAVLITILAAVIVWAALVAPDQPRDLTPAGFMRIPLEGLVLIAVAAILPTTGRRILAGVVGPILGVLVILKLLNLGFYMTFDRPFDPLGDPRYAGVGIETLRAAVGRTEANLVVGSVVAGVVVLLVVTTLAVLRVTRVAADNRSGSLRCIAGLGAAWALCWLLGVQLISQTPIASAVDAGLVAYDVRVVAADIRDESVFAKEIARDSFRSTPESRLLTGLRGKDVLLVFVESYGKVTVQGSSFAPTVDALLDTGTRQLQAAGFSARSAFVNSPTFGGISWLAHSTLQAGLWVNRQRRYDQLVATDRFTLSDAFKRAGWRTISDAPADDRNWRDGSSFYHYDKLYDRNNVGYRGPTFTYAPMPDQYLYAALERLELARTHRRPVFAEVDTVSSHVPWNRIPEQIPWRDVGNGSIFNRIPIVHETGAFSTDATVVRAAYARSIEYSLSTLISFVEHYGSRKLVLIVVGDEQPLAMVSGQAASHEVPISLIARDPDVLKRIGAWNWDAGLLPSPHAPVWPMSAFRDRFLRAFDAGSP
jgi:phosphatidylglycerophosphate synthase